MPGPFYFAWVNPGTAFNPAIHNVENEEIVSFKVDQAEGDFAVLKIDVRNPRIGLLATSRKIWAWLSWFNGTSIVPLFFGRLVGVPGNIQNEIVRFQFMARPSNFNTAKATLADTLKVAPYYDPIWIADTARDDPDTVLEARSALWHIDRITHTVTVSDVLVGEDGNEDFLVGEVPYDSVQIRLNQSPLRSVTVDGTVNWTQAAKGAVTIMSGNHFTAQNDELITALPKAGSDIGGGWKVSFSSGVDMSNVRGYDVAAFEQMGFPEFWPARVPWPVGWLFQKTVEIVMTGMAITEGLLFPNYDIVLKLGVSYDVKRDRSEHVRFNLIANVQPIFSLPEESETLILSLSSVDVGEPLPSSEIPIGDVRRRSYFPTTRGVQSLEYLIALARAHILLRSRVVEIEFECRFERAITLSCRKNARLFSHDLPGRQALGKIVAYSFGADGDGGVLIGSVTIGCAVGYGGAVAPVVGTPTYVTDGYVTVGYQVYSGSIIVLVAGDVGYEFPSTPPNDDGWNFLQPVSVADVITPWVGPTSSYHNGVLTLTFRPVEGGPFNTDYNITVSNLQVPQMINLEYNADDGILNVKDGADIAAITGTT